MMAVRTLVGAQPSTTYDELAVTTFSDVMAFIWVSLFTDLYQMWYQLENIFNILLLSYL